MNTESIRILAERGARQRVSELQGEIDQIRAEFSTVFASDAPPAMLPEQGSGRRQWTAAQKKAASERMRKSWVTRKAGQKKSK